MEPSDDRPVFNERVPQLQDMAASRIAANLAINYLNRSKEIISDCRSWPDTEKKIYKTMSDHLKIPITLEGKVQKYVSICCHQISQCMGLCEKISSGINKIAVVKEHLSNIVWKSNGQIDHLNTAVNFIYNTELGEIVKFRVMCQFCLEQKIRQAWFELEDRSFIEEQSFYEDPLLVYWNCVMTGDFSKIIKDDYTGSVEKRVIFRLRKIPPYFTAIEYFFDQLNVGDRIEFVTDIESNDRRFSDYQYSLARLEKFLIPKFTGNQLYRLFSTSDYAVRIFSVFIYSKSYDCICDALELWNHVKHLVSGEQYVNMLREMGSWRDVAFGELVELLPEFLAEFWRASPSTLKDYMFQPERDQSMFEFCIHPYDISEDYNELELRDGRILIAVLSDADIEYRKRLWSGKWEKMVNRSLPSTLKNILNFCLSPEEIISFKKEAMTFSFIREYFIKIINVGKFSLLNEFLEMLLDGNQSEIIDAKKNLFKEKINMSHSVECCEQTDEAVAAMNDFINVVFGDDAEAKAKFKKKIILGCFCPCEGNCNTPPMIYVSDRLCDKALLKEVKKLALRQIRSVFSDSESEDECNCGECICDKNDEWYDMKIWCLKNQPDDDELSEKEDNESAKRRKLDYVKFLKL